MRRSTGAPFGTPAPARGEDMKPKLKPKTRLASMGLVAALAVASTAVAETLPKEGSYDYTACWSAKILMNQQGEPLARFNSQLRFGLC